MIRILIFILFLVLWQVSSQTGIIDPFIFSSPKRVFSTFIEMLQQNGLLTHIEITLSETLASFLLVILLGVCIAILLWCSPKAAKILEPYLVVLNSLPKSALAPLLIVWLGANQKTIIIAGMSVSIFGTILNLYTGFLQVDSDKLKLIETLGGTKWDCLFKVVLPTSVPLILSVMKVNIGLCLVGVIIGEFIGARQGIGYLIIYSSQVFKMDWMIMSIILLCILAMILYGILSLLEKKLLKGRSR
jgi:NitT/TauT family transport system permease protein